MYDPNTRSDIRKGTRRAWCSSIFLSLGNTYLSARMDWGKFRMALSSAQRVSSVLTFPSSEGRDLSWLRPKLRCLRGVAERAPMPCVFSRQDNRQTRNRDGKAERRVPAEARPPPAENQGFLCFDARHKTFTSANHSALHHPLRLW